MKHNSDKKSSRQGFPSWFLRGTSFICLALILSPLSFLTPTAIGAQTPQSPTVTEPQAGQQVSGTITGKLLDPTGTPIAGAQVKLTSGDQYPVQVTTSGEEGQFSFARVVPGPFHIAITSPGFAPRESTGMLHSGEDFTIPPIFLAIATNVTEVRVELSPVEIAQAQMKDEEKQRILGVLPNFYVSYVPGAAPLNTRQKFDLAWKSSIDPVNFGLTGLIAGIQQANNTFSGYGQGAQGYAKRYGAAYADSVIGTFIGGAILPSLLRQDPRYFYKGTGTVRSRIFYAIANSVIRKGDNGHWQPDYSGVGGNLAAGAISNLYYPSTDRHDVSLTFENTLLGIAANAANNLVQEFVLRKFTTNIPSSPTNYLATP